MVSGNAEKIPVFAYHRIVPDEAKQHYLADNKFAIALSQFRWQMEYAVRHGYITLSLDEFHAWMTGEAEVPEKSLVVTFDDGHYEMYHFVLPLLKEYGLKAAVFTIGANIRETTVPYRHSTGSVQMGMDLREEMRRSYPDFTLENHTFGLHKKVDGKPFVVGMSKEEIDEDFAKWTTDAGCYLAYPFGMWTEEFMESCRSNGIKLGFCFGEQHYATRNDEPLLVPRIQMYPSVSKLHFKRWLKGDGQRYRYFKYDELRQRFS